MNNQLREAPQPTAVCNPGSDYTFIRGRKLPLAELLSPRLSDDAHVEALAARMRDNKPYSHVVVEGWFNPVLLELVQEEFDLFAAQEWRLVRSKYESTRRSLAGAHYGPASQIYFSLVNSGPFVDLMSRISGVSDLIADAGLHGGGLHETKTGGKFGIHRDFNRHPRTGLNNEMTLITYLNKNWQPQWNGALELWDEDSKQCVTKLEPDFGRSILMRNGPKHFHGHPLPLSNPADHPRRSVATYYYTNTHAQVDRSVFTTSTFLDPDRIDRVKKVARAIVPESIWSTVKNALRR